jgi:hypothetical protein
MESQMRLLRFPVKPKKLSLMVMHGFCGHAETHRRVGGSSP